MYRKALAPTRICASTRTTGAVTGTIEDGTEIAFRSLMMCIRGPSPGPPRRTLAGNTKAIAAKKRKKDWMQFSASIPLCLLRFLWQFFCLEILNNI